MSDSTPSPTFDPSHDPRDPRSSSRAGHGMTWPALVILLGLLGLMCFKIWEWTDERAVPDGATVSSAEVDSTSKLGRVTSNSKYVSIDFHLADGERGSALYRDRFFGKHEQGDKIEVYRTGERWHTTAQEPVTGVVWPALGAVVVLVLLYGWLRVRRRSRAARG